MNIKYKKCCDKICALRLCETRESGGCYCLCRLKDLEQDLMDELEGSSYRCCEFIVRDPRREGTLSESEKEKRLKALESVRERIKCYQVS